MIEKYSVRTDLALEQKEQFESDDVEVQGVILEEEYDKELDLKITKVVIRTENGAKIMKRPVGTYITMEASGLDVPDEQYHKKVSEELAKIIENLIKKKKKEYNVLIVGLGNRQITPDSLGPCTADHLIVTRHIIEEYGKYAMGEEYVSKISAIVPGVMGQTGMDTKEIIKGILNEAKQDLVIVVDALAARNTRRLNRTIQISDTGITPGSGVGNHRYGLTEETLGVPVIGIGVPTVVDAATIVNDTMENFLQALETSKMLKGVGVVLQGYNAAEKYELVRELISPHLNGMFVTPKNIDETIKRLSLTISDALNILFGNTECNN